MPNKSSRQALILQLLANGPVGSQETLRNLLEQHGLETNQATISRDCRELGLIKTNTGYMLPGSLANRTAPASTPNLSDVLSVDLAANLVILRTPAGRASMVAIQIDHASYPDVVGTIAGDDTIFVATPSPTAAKRLLRTIEKELE